MAAWATGASVQLPYDEEDQENAADDREKPDCDTHSEHGAIEAPVRVE